MMNTVATALSGLSRRVPFADALGSRARMILLYHGVPRRGPDAVNGSTFEQHIRFLKHHFDFAAPDHPETRRKAHDKIRVVLTFDDGFRNNAEVVGPILRRHGVPAEFFIASRHSASDKYLWFSYLRALERHWRWRELSFRGELLDMSPPERPRSVRRLREMLLGLEPHPSGMYEAIEMELPPLEEFVGKEELADSYAGMTLDQIGELGRDPLFSIGTHTVDHPFLTKCKPAEALRQLEENRACLESLCGRRCDSIAYPSGDYSLQLVDACRDAGFTRGYVVARRLNSRSALEVPRIGIYSSSLDILELKVRWGTMMRALRVPVG